MGELLSTTAFVGGLFVSFLFLIMVILIIARFTQNDLVVVIAGVFAVILCAGLGWIPVWVVLIIVMIVSIMYGSVVERIMGGG